MKIVYMQVDEHGCFTKFVKSFRYTDNKLCRGCKIVHPKSMKYCVRCGRTLAWTKRIGSILNV